MADVEIKYNNSTIASLNDSGTEVLETKGTFLTDDITVEYTKSGGGGDSDARLAALVDKSITDIVIPNGAMSIGTNAFYGCSSLESVVIPDSVTSIGNSSFYGCSSLESVVIPDSVTIIDTSAFSNCSNLTSIKMPSGLTRIGGYAFSNCSNLTSIEIPNNVTDILTSAFSNCSSLTSITCEAITPPTLRSNVFNKVPDTCAIYVPAESVAAYKAANNWSNRAAYIQAIQTT